MNVSYYQGRVSRWIRWDVAIRSVSAAAASATIITAARQNSILGIEMASVLALASAGFTIAGVTLRIPDKVRELGVLLAEYTGHYHRFAKMYQFGCTDDELRVALESFAATEIREATDHPTPNAAMIEKSRKEVLASIGSADPSS
jgi:hypothetical protein